MIHLVNLKLQIGFLDVLAKYYVPFSPVGQSIIFIFTEPPPSPRLFLEQGGAPRVSQGSIRVCWLPALDSSGLNDLRYNVYIYNTDQDDPIYNRVNSDGVVR